MEYVFLILFIIITCAHLYASLRHDKPLRNRTKPFILLSLIGFYCCNAEHISAFVAAALIFSWIGDMLLIPNGNKWFTAGGISFMISHLCFIMAYAGLTDFSKVSTAALVVLPIIFIVSTAAVFKFLRPHLPEVLFYPMMLYLFLNGAMNCFAWFRSISTGGTAAIVTAIGALLFYASDTSLFFVRFDKESRLRTHFPVMLTYSLGEFLIVLGLI